jgi:DNA-binding transcriptional LysR family regulator
MLDELRTFVAFADAGSLHKAAGRLFLTPSAVTRQIQRLEAGLGAALLDRRLKPARLTAAGRAVLERSRELLRSVDDLKAVASPEAEPRGTFRLGLAHALAQPGLVRAIQRLRRRFPGLETSFVSEMTDLLLARVERAELDMALVLVPVGRALPDRLAGAAIRSERFAPVERRQAGRAKPDLSGPWILNPRGCLIREAFRDHLERSGTPLRLAAEVHNPELQLSMIAAGIGRGVMPLRFLARHPRRARVRVIRGWELEASLTVVRPVEPGRLAPVAAFLDQELRAHYRPDHRERTATSS